MIVIYEEYDEMGSELMIVFILNDGLVGFEIYSTVSA